MSYPRWLPQTLTQWLLCACCVPLLALLCTGAYLGLKYGTESCAAARDTLIHGKGLVTEVQRAAKRSVQTSDDTDTAVKHLDEAVENLKKLIGNLNTVALAAPQTADKVNKTLDNAAALEAALEERVAGLAVEQDKAGKLIDAYAALPSAVTTALKPLPGLELSLTNLADSGSGFLSNEDMKLAIKNLGRIEGSGANFLDGGTVIESDIHGYIKPWDHTHPAKHYSGVVGKTALGLAGTGASIGVAITK